MRTLGIVLISFSLLACIRSDAGGGNAHASADAYRLETVTREIRQPWGMTWLPDGDMLVTSRPGVLYRLSPEGELTVIGGLPDIHVNGQGGLLDIILSPNFATDGWLYLSYASPARDALGSNTAIARARLVGNTLTEREVLYKAEPDSASGQHYGSRMAFDQDGLLYFSIGDRGDRDSNPQDLSRDGGKIYRLNANGSVPTDNPFVGQAGALPAIYSYGHRNPQGMARHPVSGAIWIHEHGPRGGDEINIVKAGANYGWPILSYGINYNGTSFAEAQAREGYESPRHYWTPSIAPSGMTFVTSGLYPEWQGHLLVGSLKFGYIEWVRLRGDQVAATARLFEDIGRVRDIRQGPDGYLYVATEGDGILRVVPRDSP
ncbi:PQQ-dependent sugar dehydrogenase, partial [Litorivivens sp.]|uniref:PQQ-dependent sugar dehydrogenase n=3 Tax=Litorivivens sp. TaxID=2020868 RepID=UPI00356AFA44